MSFTELIQLGAQGWGYLLFLATLLTLSLTAVALVLGCLVGTMIAAAKLSKSPFLRLVGFAYTTFFRGVPELLIIYLIYFGGSSLVTALGVAMGYDGFLGLPSFLAGVLAVGLISAAYQAEVYRGAFLSISRGEIEAAQAIGMSKGLRFRRIIAPQVARFSIPGIGNVWQLSIKDSALVSVTGLAELMRTSQMAASSTRQYFVFFITGGIIYLLMTSVSDRVFLRAERKANRSMRSNLGNA